MTTRNVLTQFRRPALFALLAAVLLVLSGCDTTATDATAGEEAAGDTTDTISIVGTWTGDCGGTPTTMTFNDNFTFVEAVNQMTFSGNYSVSNSTVTLETDNGNYSYEISDDGTQLSSELSDCIYTLQSN